MTTRPKLLISSLIKDSRLTKSFSPVSYSIVDNILSDIYIKHIDKHLIFLSITYFNQNPRYL